MSEAVVTGIGAITPLGTDSAGTWTGVRDGESGIAQIAAFDPDAHNLRSKIVGRVAFDADDYEFLDDRGMGRYAQLALVAAHEAVTDAGLAPDADTWRPERVGVSVGTGMGGFPEIEETVTGERVSPRFVISQLPNLAAGYVGQTFDATGPNRAPATACAAGTHAIGAALDDIRLGRADVMIAGGTEAALSPTGIRGFDAMRALSTANDAPAEASRPFDADRDGFVIAEGAGVLVLETPDHAFERGADPLATVTGYAQTADAHHPTRPPDDAHGLQRCIRAAIRDAGREPDDIDHVNAHGTGTRRGDPHEATALRSVFDDRPPVTSLKSAIGHTLGASGAIEAVVSTTAIREGIRPPTQNYETPDPECDVPIVETAQPTAGDVVLSNSAGFGGTNGSLVIERYDH